MPSRPPNSSKTVPPILCRHGSLILESTNRELALHTTLLKHCKFLLPVLFESPESALTPVGLTMRDTDFVVITIVLRLLRPFGALWRW